jgi:pimeloyl-ACP methyl ester carboxylesterase
VTTSFHIRDGLRLCVSEIGAGETLVFQHGLCADAAQPAEIFPEGHGWRCLTLECRGHGRSDAGPPDRMSIADFTDDLAAMLRAKATGPVVLGGISMGAAMALRLAVRCPELVRGLFLARPAWVDLAAPANLAPNALVGDLLARFSPSEARSRFEASAVALRLAAEAPDNLTSLRGFFSREPVAVTSELLRRIPADGPGVSSREIEALRVPALVLGTAHDLAHPSTHVDALARMIPGARRRLITSKFESRERYRDEFRAALADFLREFGA